MVYTSLLYIRQFKEVLYRNYVVYLNVFYLIFPLLMLVMHIKPSCK